MAGFDKAWVVYRLRAAVCKEECERQRTEHTQYSRSEISLCG